MKNWHIAIKSAPFVEEVRMTFQRLIDQFESIVSFIKSQELSDNETTVLVTLVICATLFSFGIAVAIINKIWFLLSWPYRVYTIRARDRYSDEVIERLKHFEEVFQSGTEGVMEAEFSKLIGSVAPELVTNEDSLTLKAIDTGLALIAEKHFAQLDTSDPICLEIISAVPPRLQMQFGVSNSEVNQVIDKELVSWVEHLFSDESLYFDSLLNKMLAEQIVSRGTELAAKPGSNVQTIIDSELTRWTENMFIDYTEFFEDDLNKILSDGIVNRASTLLSSQTETKVGSQINQGILKWTTDMFSEYVEHFEDDLNATLGSGIVSRAKSMIAMPDSKLLSVLEKSLVEWTKESAEDILEENSQAVSTAIVGAILAQVTAAMGDANGALSHAAIACIREKLEA